MDQLGEEKQSILMASVGHESLSLGPKDQTVLSQKDRRNRLDWIKTDTFSFTRPFAGFLFLREETEGIDITTTLDISCSLV